MTQQKDTVEFPFNDPEQYGDVRTIAARAGIELRGEDGQPYCCGAPMKVMAGLMGPDYARCESCGKEIRNLASPHVNGGYVLNEDVMERYGDALWTIHDAGKKADAAA